MCVIKKEYTTSRNIYISKVSKDTINIATYLAVCIFNGSFQLILEIFHIIRVKISIKVKKFADAKERIERSE